jgi:hypothetical protein
MAPFGCADKPAKKHCWLICWERKTMFWLKKQAEKTDYKPDEQSLYIGRVRSILEFIALRNYKLCIGTPLNLYRYVEVITNYEVYEFRNILFIL